MELKNIDYVKLIIFLSFGIFIIHTITPYPDKFTIYPSIDKYMNNKKNNYLE
jgi:hypothetical protein